MDLMIALYVVAALYLVAVFVARRVEVRAVRRVEMVEVFERVWWSPDRRYVTSGGWAMWLVETPEGVAIQGSNGQVSGNCRGEWPDSGECRASAPSLQSPGDEWVLAVAEFMDYLEVAR